VAPIPFTRLFGTSGRRALESIVPRRTFDDVILPPATRHALRERAHCRKRVDRGFEESSTSGQWRVRRHGKPGIHGNPSNAESVTYRI
jgi:hypothetical protein